MVLARDKVKRRGESVVACSRAFGLHPKRDAEWTWRENRIGACFLLSYDRRDYNGWQYPCTGCVETSLRWKITLKITSEFIDSVTLVNKFVLSQPGFSCSSFFIRLKWLFDIFMSSYIRLPQATVALMQFIFAHVSKYHSEERIIYLANNFEFETLLI